ncbi:chromatin modification-related protein EAF1 B-like [Benincasa hispida]|uniref:chromatin modification-related protein EAF1 B-like n=1 Tax=Benincasa hispida TaxID=102211 RepID=UPI0018FFA3E5|nr:chromatin modification-related protein EAF1 B-like [Benincasa hispida]XP_038877295.1 chromatin modification-related protein EAF1 B-like [Benincasa hispida]XP_038877296.1 chromatin modification-related protein EAF1 B-like [Benincasa hispida]XP_038877297.1 chromatin modification-related protein EAF1 B-like [Benincasa hispida]
MGGVVDGGVGIGLNTSPRRAAIEKAQAELRLEYDVREERRRELEFLEKGGNPLDFKFGNTTSVSQSTSRADQLPDQLGNSDAKGSFVLTASPHGDSVESSGIPGPPSTCEPNSADNLLLLRGANELSGGERTSRRPSSKASVAPSEQSSQLDGSQNNKETEDSAIFRPYARRHRSRSNRDGGRSSSSDIVRSHGGNTSYLATRQEPREFKGTVPEMCNEKNQSLSNPKSLSSNGDNILKMVTIDGRLDMELNGTHDPDTTPDTTTATTNGSPPESEFNNSASRCLKDNLHKQPSQVIAQQARAGVGSQGPNVVGEERELVPDVVEQPTSVATPKVESEITSAGVHGCNELTKDSKMPNGGQNGNVVLGKKQLGLVSSSNKSKLGLDVNMDIDMCNNSRKVDSKRNSIEQLTSSDQTSHQISTDGMLEKEAVASDSTPVTHDDHNVSHQNISSNGSASRDGRDSHTSRPNLHNEVNIVPDAKEMEQGGKNEQVIDEKKNTVSGEDSKECRENLYSEQPEVPLDSSKNETRENTMSGRNSSALSDVQGFSGRESKQADKAYEDSILEEARIIEAKHKRIAELSVHTQPLENRRKSHWDFVLEEMAWLANDFMQERIWKTTAATQLCRRAAIAAQLRNEKQKNCGKIKEVSHSLAKIVMQFWHSAEEPSKEVELRHPKNRVSTSLKEYARRFLKCNSSLCPQHAEAPKTPDRMSDSLHFEMPSEEKLKEVSLFYTIPIGAMDIYRRSVEALLLRCEKIGSCMQEEVETSLYDTLADNAYDEEGEACMYFESSKSSKFVQKKRKHSIKSYTGRQYEMGTDLPYGRGANGTQQSMLIGKRPASLNVGPIPTKKMRTASRQRVVSPFSGGAALVLHGQAKTDASSGDTNSFQDDQSTLRGGSQLQKSMEVESVGDVQYDSAETSVKYKKKKKAKHLGSMYDHRWQLDSTVFSEQRDNSKKRLDNHQFESNATSGLHGQHNAKKPKLMKQSIDNTFDNINPVSGSIPSPVASQVSNMSNTNRIIRLIGGRDRSRKAKAVKMSDAQSGSGSPWSLFEDQALVVLVHDLGPNWELVSDAINSTLQFKCIYRKPKECKERHKFVMDKNSGDGADSGEDSGSSQPYPSTLPGIPKGSARQLFQRLQEPMEEDTLKSHFEKIFKIGQKQHYRRSQEPKQIVQPHGSHAIALSQVFPNNLNGVILTPLDLCEEATSSPDVLPGGYQSPHASGLSITNQGSVASVLPNSGVKASLQGSSAMVQGTNLSAASGSLNNIRDGRYSVLRTSLPVDEQKRIQQYNQMPSGKNAQQSHLSVPLTHPGNERGVRMLPGANGLGMMCTVNRCLPVSRPGFQGMASSPVLNTGSSSSMGGMSVPANIHTGAGSGQGNSALKPREALHVMRPGQNTENQRQMMVPELQMQVTGNNNRPLNGSSSAFPNQTTPPSIPPYPGHLQSQHQMSPQQSHAHNGPHHPHLQSPNHAIGPQQQYAMRLANERKLHQQRFLQQQQLQQKQQQFSTSSSLTPHVPPQPQLPMTSLNSPQVHLQTSSPQVSLPPLTSSSPMTPTSSQHQMKHHLPPHGLSRNPGASGLNNQAVKQRQQSARHHPQQRQQVQSPQQAKLMKGVGRGSMLVHQNLAVDANILNGLNVPPGDQPSEKGEQIMQLMQGQGSYYGSGVNTVQHSKPLVPQASNHSQLQKNLVCTSGPPSSKPVLQMPSHSEKSSQGQVPPVSSCHTLSTSHQDAPASIIAPNHPPSQPPQKQVNQTQTSFERSLQQSSQGISDPRMKAQTDLAQADQQPHKQASQVGTDKAMPQTSATSTDTTPITSVSSQWKPSEPAYDSDVLKSKSQLGLIGSSPLTNFPGGEPLPNNLGLGPRQSSRALPSHGHNAGLQWPQQVSLQQSPNRFTPSQQQEKQQDPSLPQHQQPLQQQAQHQSQHKQAEQGSLYLKPENANME